MECWGAQMDQLVTDQKMEIQALQPPYADSRPEAAGASAERPRPQSAERSALAARQTVIEAQTGLKRRSSAGALVPRLDSP